jgi:phenylpyruvate tautomerase PptA (4-oxalocrotonate tautomerase family)
MAERVTQVAVEVLRKAYTETQVAQQVVEVLREGDSTERVTQIAVEVLRKMQGLGVLCNLQWWW